MIGVSLYYARLSRAGDLGAGLLGLFEEPEFLHDGQIAARLRLTHGASLPDVRPSIAHTALSAGNHSLISSAALSIRKEPYIA